MIPKSPEQERARSLSTKPLFDSVNSRLSKSNENLNQTNSQKQSPTVELPRNERLTKSEDRHLSNTVLNDLQIQRYNTIKDKFERQQPIDIPFGIYPSIKKTTIFIFFLLADPRRYPFKILLSSPYPLVNTDIHLLSMSFSCNNIDFLFILVDIPHIAYVQITVNNIEVPIQAARRNDNTFLLKFRPIIAGDYSIILKNFHEQPIKGCPFLFPVYNPNVVHLEAFNRLQPINDCHLICMYFPMNISSVLNHLIFVNVGNVDRAGPGNLFVMVYSQLDDQSFQPIFMPIQIQPRPSNHIRIALSPTKIGTYRIYVAYRNLPVNGMLSFRLN